MLNHKFFFSYMMKVLRYLCMHGHVILLDNTHQYSLRPFGGIAGSEALPAPPV